MGDFRPQPNAAVRSAAGCVARRVVRHALARVAGRSALQALSGLVHCVSPGDAAYRAVDQVGVRALTGGGADICGRCGCKGDMQCRSGDSGQQRWRKPFHGHNVPLVDPVIKVAGQLLCTTDFIFGGDS